MLQGYFGLHNRNGGIKPFQKLKAQELQKELSARGFDVDQLKRPELEKKLDQVLGGVQRVPTVLIGNHRGKLEDVGCGRYEILPTESLHDIKEHSHNLWTELRYDIH